MPNTARGFITSRPGHAFPEHFPMAIHMLCECLTLKLKMAKTDWFHPIQSINIDEASQLLSDSHFETPAARQGRRLFFIWTRAQIRNAANFSVACKGLSVKGTASLACLGCDTNQHVGTTHAILSDCSQCLFWQLILV